MAKRTAEEPQRPTKKPTKTPSKVLVSICIPSTVISSKNAYNLEQITNIAYQIAKAATIYNVTEIVILDVPDQQEIDEKVVQMAGSKGGKKMKFNFSDEDIVNEETPDIETKEKKESDDAYLLASLLQFFVTPPYLVKSIFPPELKINKNILKKLHYAYKLPKMTTLPFMGNNDVFKHFKEGMTIARETPKVMNKKTKVKAAKKISVTKFVNIGEAEPLELNIKREVPVNSRVTVDIKNKTIVSPAEAYGVVGNKSSFGYYIRMCKRFSQIFTESSVPEGYSSSVYVNCDDYHLSNKKIGDFSEIRPISKVEGNVLLVLGNFKDLQNSFEQDKSNLEGVDSVGQMFDGSMEVPKGVRAEDGLLVALTKVDSLAS
ncbi:DUF171-domain-containing protein [Suhomyces tanzawaensis NRRL Y-17324]|uniref:DUF171-domain-containing protein n=1 Tax=Suhomyces tanzawaensis NRRL Y-17324 TaxID=984487 RepID=A0A1E4SFV9_9ASCO|nr:DUF171-domain-containing protein [Suhomyces tanzawaensis NRRL Y-17324]ODV78398.1 DUF171-domain-containing protein [Suhomyces tanzawaensis NRRL Y-17324]